MINPAKLWARGFRPYRKTTLTYARQMDRAFRVRLDTGETLYGQAGDYACISPEDGGKWIVARAIFEHTYRPAPIKADSPDDKHIRLMRQGFRPYRKHQLTWARKISKPRVIHTLEGDVPAAAGDYVCVGSKGEMWPQKPARFESHYERAKAPARSK